MVVHASAGAAALACSSSSAAAGCGPTAPRCPTRSRWSIIGAGILWFGWFGFNAGDGLQANGVAAQALVNTQVAAAAAMLVWLLMERLTEGHATVLGGVTGAVAGLATITPCAGYVNTTSAIAIGVLAGLVCHLALRRRRLQVRRRARRHRRALRRWCARLAARRPLRRGGDQQHRRRRTLLRRRTRLARRAGPRARLRDRLLVLLTWIIAIAIEQTIGLVSPEDEEPGRRAAGHARLRLQQRRSASAPSTGRGSSAPERSCRGGCVSGRSSLAPGAWLWVPEQLFVPARLGGARSVGPAHVWCAAG